MNLKHEVLKQKQSSFKLSGYRAYECASCEIVCGKSKELHCFSKIVIDESIQFKHFVYIPRPVCHWGRSELKIKSVTFLRFMKNQNDYDPLNPGLDITFSTLSRQRTIP